MKTITLVGLALCASTRLAAANAGTCQLASGAACTTVAPPLVAAPSGMGQYCSITWPEGGWSFTSNTNLDGDPCAGAPAGGTVQRAGMYAVNARNYVVERCTDGHIGLRYGTGNGPLTSAYLDAQGHPGCTFTVTPGSFPVFRAPFSLSPLPAGYSHGTGFDFARYPYRFIDLANDFQSSSRTQAFFLDDRGNQRDGGTATTLTAGSNGDLLPISTLHVGSTSGFPSSGTLAVATIDNGAQTVSYTGKTATSFTGVTDGAGELATGGLVVVPYGFIDDHQGHDIGMAEGTPLYAMADGVVDRARFRNVANVNPSNPNACANWGDQGEIYIRHRFSGGKSQYDEVYESYYAHMKTITVSTGDIVHKGDQIGTVGHTGCTSGGNHLHLSVFRLTNTASAKSYPLIINTNFGPLQDQNSDLGYRNAIEPYGFTPPTTTAFDPWGWRGTDASTSCYDSLRGWVPCDWGALSVDLWKSGQQPPLTPSGASVTW